MGEIKRSDSLFGFNFSVKYDTSKIRFEAPAYIGTLAENFEWKDVNFGLTPGYVVGFAAHVSMNLAPVYGNKPLIGFWGYWKTECLDSTELEIDYLEFTDEFQREVKNFIPVTVNAIIKENVNRTAKVTFTDNKIEIKKDSTIEYGVNIEINPGNRIKRLKIETDNPEERGFNLVSIETNDIIAEVLDIQYYDTSIVAELELKTELSGLFEVLKFNLNRTKVKGDTLIINANVIEYDECACITKSIPGSMTLESPVFIDTTDTTNFVENMPNRRFNVKYNQYENKLHCELNNEIISEIVIYDIKGIPKLKIMNLNIDSIIDIDIEKLSIGTYILIAKSNRDIYNKIFIKY